MLKVRFGAGETTATADSSLYQWDYGQHVEVEADDLPAIIEAHFTCDGMEDAVVQSCSVISNVATIPIPDVCLESGTNIKAWIFEITDSTHGRTSKEFTIPVIQRKKPRESRELEHEFTDAYTELLGEINEAIAALQRGDVVAARALNADKATQATSAIGAQTATFSQMAQKLTPTWKTRNSLQNADEGISTYAIKVEETGLYFVEADYIDTDSSLSFFICVSKLGTMSVSSWSVFIDDIYKNNCSGCRVKYMPASNYDGYTFGGNKVNANGLYGFVVLDGALSDINGPIRCFKIADIPNLEEV